ncbi:MAG: hypothetical protein COY81_05295 [Candidatus Pacebacteria bacterium CG_4_10_14_0_8_um_filter_43_12]|nr:MAG: hypothetical protein COU66_04340 [Candidatus Pacebacteria bacterium CG10_big_fil_rev_8_21_14_0_10_44_11]PIY78966.1 MAG: hypothetical protein COY81_05295 [Candidatus Pacebacteria bacterium CG_4_10_14_0_8_um_filter_43_12]
MTEIDSGIIKIFWSTRRAMVLSVLFVLGALVLISAVVIPQFQQSWDLYNDLQKEQPKLEKLQQKQAELNDIEVSPEFAQINTIEEALPSHKPLLELLMALSSVSQDTGTVVKDFELSPGLVASDSTALDSKSKTAYDQLSLDLTIEGTFRQIQDFLLKVEEVSPFTTIVSMEIGNQINTNAAGFVEQTSQDPTFEAVLTTQTYFYTQSIASRIDSPLPKISQKEVGVLNLLAAFNPTNLEQQTEIRGGGLQDLFQITTDQVTREEIESIPALVPVPTATPELVATPAPITTPEPTVTQ